MRLGVVGQDDGADRKDGINRPWASARAFPGARRFTPLARRPDLTSRIQNSNF